MGFGADNIKQKILDEIDTIKCDFALIKQNENVDGVVFSGCPLFRTGRDVIMDAKK